MRNLTLTRMIKITSVVTLSLTLALTPAAANSNPHHYRQSETNQDVATFIAALFGLAALGAILSDDDEDKKYTHRPKRVHKPKVQKPKRPKFKRLPSQCLRRHNTQFGKVRYWGEYCLRQNGVRVANLPRQCANSAVVRNQKGKYVARKVYEPSCMRANGYRKTR